MIRKTVECYTICNRIYKKTIIWFLGIIPIYMAKERVI